LNRKVTPEDVSLLCRYTELAVAQPFHCNFERKLTHLAAAVAKHAALLEAKVDELTQLARERDGNPGEQQADLAKQQNLLDHDRDIRQLKGARDLYSAEIHDVGGGGETDKTYGRVFIPKGSRNRVDPNRNVSPARQFALQSKLSLPIEPFKAVAKLLT
jgi:hypothetical protein